MPPDVTQTPPSQRNIFKWASTLGGPLKQLPALPWAPCTCHSSPPALSQGQQTSAYALLPTLKSGLPVPLPKIIPGDLFLTTSSRQPSLMGPPSPFSDPIHSQPQALALLLPLFVVVQPHESAC